MARKRTRKKSGSPGGVMTLIIALAVAAVAYFLYLSLKPERSVAGATSEFSVSKYRYEGSGLAVPGNRYRLEGCIENIDTVAGARIVTVSLNNSKRERLPLLVPADCRLSVNLTRRDSFIFTTECRNGRSADGSEVRGILVVTDAESTK